MTAISLLIGKDSVQRLVAGIQPATDDMVRPGDWAESTLYEADEDLIGITLCTVR